MTWLLGVVPPDYLLHGVLRRHPIALAALARHHLGACVEGARNGYRTARTELGPHLPPGAVEAVLTAYRSEGSRLASAACAAGLIERALHGEQFVPSMSRGARAVAPAGRDSRRDQPAGGVKRRGRVPDASSSPRSQDPRLPDSPERRRQPGNRQAGSNGSAVVT